MAAELLSILIKINLAAAAAILLILLLRKPARKAFGARLAYALWLIVPLASAATLIPGRKLVLTLAAEKGLSLPVESSVDPVPSSTISATPVDLASIALGLWLIGSIAFGLVLIWRQQRFVRDLNLTRTENGYLRAAASEAGPMVVGALRPQIVLPTDFEIRFDPQERDLVLAHESAHLAAGDTRINALVAAVQCLAWFNPLVHIAAGSLRLDQELACDAAVLAHRSADRHLYATALLKAQTHALPLPVGCYWPAGAHPLKERIVMMKSPSPSRRRALAGSMSLVGLCAGAAATAWAAQPARVVVHSAPTAVLSVAAPTRAYAQANAIEPSGGKLFVPSANTTPRPESVIASSTTISAQGRTFERIDAPPPSEPSRFLRVMTADGKVRTIFPRPWSVPPHPVAPSQLLRGLNDVPEPEAVRLARLTIADVKADHDARAARGAPPPLMTPQLEAALKLTADFDRDAHRARSVALLAILDELIAKESDVARKERLTTTRESLRRTAARIP